MTASELLHSITELGVALTDDEVGKYNLQCFRYDRQVDEMMRIADLDGDGKMKFSEFCKLMELLVPSIEKKSQKEVTMLLVLK